MSYTYATRRDFHRDRMRIIVTRDDGLTAQSSWWGVDDGSAECEAHKQMRALESRENNQDNR